MGRRGHNEGTIYQRRDGLWAGQVTVGKDAATGGPRRLTFYGKSKSEVREKMEKARAKYLTAGVVEPAKVTVGDWLRTWLGEYARPKVRPTTFKGYEEIVRLHLVPALGAVKLKDLRPEHLQRLYNTKLAEGLSPRTVRLIHTVAHAALKQAVKEGLVARNPSEATSPPRQERKEMRVLSMEEQERFLAALEGERLGAAFLLALGTGLRCGEILALRWQDINWQAGTLTVSRNLVQVRTYNEEGKKTALLFQEPKTAKGRRTIPLPGAVLAALKAHRARQAQEKLLAGPSYQDNDLLFATHTGGPIHPRNFTRDFYRVVEKAGIGKANLHALRHTFATRLLEAGEHPKVVQELLGHSQISLTLDTYSHVGLDLKRRAVEKLDCLLPTKNEARPHGEGHK